MKKFVLLLAVCGLLFASCIKDSVPKEEGGTKNIYFTLRTSDGFIPGLSVGTRAADIYSSDALQNIKDAKVHQFDASRKYMKTYDLEPLWVQGQNSATYVLKSSEFLPNGKYTFMAIGIDQASDYSTSPNPLVVGTTTPEDIFCTMTGTVPQEIFSNTIDHTVAKLSEHITVGMWRRVAGVLGYFKIPTTLPHPTTKNDTAVARLQLKLQGSNTKVIVTGAGDPPNKTSSAPTGPAYNIFDVDLTTQVDANGNGILDGTPTPTGVGKLDETTLIGAYVVPVDFTSGNTMELSLLAADGTVLRKWTVLDTPEGTTTPTPSFNIVQNNFYSFGQKLRSANTDGGEPTDPTKADNPLDLRKQQITASALSGWSTKHPMSLDAQP